MSNFGAGLVYAFLSLDQNMVGPFLLARPVVAGTAVGAVLGDVSLGFSVGLAAELLSMAAPPVGLAAADACIVGALAALWSVEAWAQRDAAALVALLVAAPCGWAVTQADRWVRRHNDRFVDWILGHLAQGRERVLWKALGAWAALWFLKAWIVFAVLGALGQLLVDAALRHLPLRTLEGLDAGARLLPVACFAAAVGYFWDRLKPAAGARP